MRLLDARLAGMESCAHLLGTPAFRVRRILLRRTQVDQSSVTARGIGSTVANRRVRHENGAVFQPGQPVRVNLAGLRVKNVTFQAAVTDAVGHIVRQVSEDPPVFLVRLLFSFRGVDEVEVPADRIKAAS
jgi:hypothetical protein